MKKKKKDYGEFPENGGDAEILSGAASTTDCTGLIPAGSMKSEETFGNYNEICAFSASEVQKDIRRSRKGSK